MSQSKVQTRQLEPLHFRAAVRPESINPESRTAELVISTGARVLRYGWDGPQFEELSLDPAHIRMDRINNGAPLLNCHNSYELTDVIGVVEAARLEGGVLTGTVRFARAEDDPKAECAFRKVKDGILRNVSVGYRTHKLEKVEGGDDQIPVYRATDWEPYEVSLVPMGADDGAKVRAEVPTNACRVESPGEEGEMAPKAVPETPATETRQPDAPPATPAAPIQPAPEDQERQRADGILHACEAARLPISFARTLISEKLPLVDAQRRVLDELAKRGADDKGPAPGPSGAPDKPADTRSAAEQLDALVEDYRKANPNASHTAAFAAVQRANPKLAEAYAEELQQKRR